MHRIACEAGQLVAIGSNPFALLRGQAGALSTVSETDAEYSVVRDWLISSSNAWVVGEGTTKSVRHIDGATWRVYLEQPTLSLKAIQSLPDGRVFALGDRALISRAP